MASKEQTQPVDQEDDRLQKEMNLYHNVAKAIFSRLGKEDKDNASEAYALCEEIIWVAVDLERDVNAEVERVSMGNDWSQEELGETAREEMKDLRGQVRTISEIDPMAFKGDETGSAVVKKERSRHMATAANESGQKGTWKIGESHVEDMRSESMVDPTKVNLISEYDFQDELINLYSPPLKKTQQEQS